MITLVTEEKHLSAEGLHPPTGWGTVPLLRSYISPTLSPCSTYDAGAPSFFCWVGIQRPPWRLGLPRCGHSGSGRPPPTIGAYRLNIFSMAYLDISPIGIDNSPMSSSTSTRFVRTTRSFSLDP